MALITYVIPTLNSESTLDFTLASLINQVSIEIDIFVVDSGSTDGTLDICKKWNVPTLYAKPGNMYHAINIGLAQCKSVWAAYLNSDDYLYPNSVSRLVQHGEQSNADVVYGNCDYVDFQGRFMYSFSPPKPKWLKPICRTGGVGFAQQTAIFKHDLYQNIGGFDESYRFVADRAFYVRALMEEASFSCLTGPSIACFRLHKNQFSQKQVHFMWEEGARIQATLAHEQHALDKAIRLMWRLSNLPNYVIRVIRQSMLAERLTVHRSMNSGAHSSDISS